jgi:uncharacterized protein
MTEPTGNIDRLPTQANERLLVLDALRGFALLGILFVNYTWFTGFAVLFGATPERIAALGTLQIDTFVNQIVIFLVDSKFWSIFALLFGVGLGMQLIRLDDRQHGLQILRRRLAILLLVGLAHGSLIWFGDIVCLYAATGFALLMFARVSTTALLPCGLFFLALPVLQSAIWLTIYSQLQHGGSAPPDLGHGPPEMLAHFAHGSASEALEANWAYFGKRWIRAVCEGRCFKLLGMFLLGFWAARKQMFVDSALNRKLLRRVMIAGLAIGIPANWFYAGTGGGVVLPLDATELARTVNQCIGIPAMACGYVAAFLLAYSYQPHFKCWNVFASVGRLSLTNYIAQSVVGVVVFYGCGLGMWGRVGITWSLLVIAITFLAQSVFSRWWLRTYRYGPLEWSCRCLVYATVLPLRHHRSVRHPIAVSKE